MSKKIFVPPIPSIREYIPENLTDEDFEKMTKLNAKNSKSYAIMEEKYIIPIRKREKAYKKRQRIEWWKTHWIDLAALIISVIALLKSYETEIVSVILWCKQLLEKQ